MIIIAKGFFLSFGISCVLLLYLLPQITKLELKKRRKYYLFFLLWILPAFLFNLLIRTDHAGYQMDYLSCFLILIAFIVWKISKKNSILFICILSFACIFNLYWFFHNRDPSYTKPLYPTTFHYSDIRKNDLITGSKVAFVQQKFNPKNTYIITTDIFWRQYSYYLKNYYLTALFGLDSKSKPYMYNQYDGYNWDIKWHQNNKFIIAIPSNISTIIFMDDPSKSWVKKYPFKTYNLPGNSRVTSISVKPNYKIVYNYHQIRIIK